MVRHCFGRNARKSSPRAKAPSELASLTDALFPRQAQNFNMYFDTGSSDFTVASTNCPNSKCGTKDRYDVAASSTAVQTSTYVRTNFVDGTTSEG
jgi:hypothetical protein